MSRRVSLLGATGSIGRSTAAVIAEVRAREGEDAIEVEAIAGGRDVAALVEMARALRPRFVAISDPGAGPSLREALAAQGVVAESGAGLEAVMEAAGRDASWVMSAIVGAAALAPTVAAARRGATIALANKECVVCAGALLKGAAQEHHARIIPVDSEHSAVFQVLGRPEEVERVTLTASGGPFRGATRAEMANATPEQACRHPTWSMGAKISVDSATMMNKGLEIIEAAILFDLAPEVLDVVVHPQSIVHSLVGYRDGSTLAQLSYPDMRVPIAVALAWPKRAHVSARRLDLGALGSLTFEAPDDTRFPALRLAREALIAGGAAPLVLNAANEIAVGAFLRGRIGFLEIAEVVEDALGAPSLSGVVGKTPASFLEVAELDQQARDVAREATERRAAA